MKIEILNIIRTEEGLTGYQIHERLCAISRAARWFGKDSFLVTIFGPSTVGMYFRLLSLEAEGKIRSHWGEAKERGGHRPRHYYPIPLSRI